MLQSSTSSSINANKMTSLTSRYIAKWPSISRVLSTLSSFVYKASMNADISLVWHLFFSVFFNTIEPSLPIANTDDSIIYY